MQRTVKLDLECLCSRELPGNMLSLLSADLGDVIGGSTFQNQRILKQVPLAQSIVAETEADFRLVTRSATKSHHPDNQPNAEAGSFPRDVSRVGSVLETDSRLSSLLSFASPPCSSHALENLSLKNASVSLPNEQSLNAATEFGQTAYHLSVVASPQMQLDELTKAVSRKMPAVQNPNLMARSVVQQYTYLDVPINANNDNGSNVIAYIPNIYDFEASKHDYEPNVVDPELLPLPLLDETPFPDDFIVTRGACEYYLTVSQPALGNGGRIRLWDSARKDNEYTVFNTWTTQNMKPFPNGLNPGFYSHPQIFLEGVEPSWEDHEMQITLKVKWDANGFVWTSNYRTVKATVTPRVDYLRIENHNKFFGRIPNPNANVPPVVVGINSSTGSYAYVEMKAKTIGFRGRGTPHFVQNLMPGTADLLTIPGKPGIHKVSFSDGKAAHGVFSPANVNFPLVDSDNQNAQGSEYPYYGPLPFLEWDLATNDWKQPRVGPDANDNRIFYRESSDSPGLNSIPPTWDGSKWDALDYISKFKLWLVLAYPADPNSQAIMYAMANIKWEARINPTNYQVGQGLTTLGQLPTSDQSFVRSNQKPDRTSGPVANGTWIISIPA